MKYLVDNQLPTALARHLSSKGIECRHVRDCGLGEASDREIWRHAVENDEVVVSKDEDFVYLATTSPGARLVWVRLGNCRKAQLLATFDRLFARIEDALGSGETIVELR